MAQSISACWRPLLFGVLGLGLLALLPTCASEAVRGGPAYLRAQAEAQASAALNAAGHGWARLEVGADGSGRLIGLPPSPEASAAALAVLGAALKDQIGFPGVIARLTPNASAQDDAAPAASAADPTAPVAAPAPAPPTSAPPIPAPPPPAPAAPPSATPSNVVQVAADAALASAGPRTCQAALRRALSTDPIRFASGSAEVAGVGRANFARLAAVVNACDRHRLLVAGHTDPRGAAGVNQRLSLARARAVRALLIEAGAEAGRLRAVGFGETRLVDAGRTSAAFARNRRIEITVQAR